MFAQQLNVTLERPIAIICGEAFLDLLVGEALKLPSLATHSSALRVGS
jgi:hypothetical protein